MGDASSDQLIRQRKEPFGVGENGSSPGNLGCLRTSGCQGRVDFLFAFSREAFGVLNSRIFHFSIKSQMPIIINRIVF